MRDIEDDYLELQRISQRPFGQRPDSEMMKKLSIAMTTALEKWNLILQSRQTHRYEFEVIEHERPDLWEEMGVWCKVHLKGSWAMHFGTIWVNEETDAVLLRLAYGECLALVERDDNGYRLQRR